MSTAEQVELAASLTAPAPPTGRLLQRPNGLHIQVPEDEYHERILGVASKGALDLVRYAPAVYRAWVDGLTDEPEESKAMLFGKAAHCALLEPDRFARDYAVLPDFGDGRTKAAKERRDEWRAAHAGALPLTEDDARHIDGMRSAINDHPVAGSLFRMLWHETPGVHAEATLLWDCAETGLRCRARDDLYVDGQDEVLDLKTCADCRPEAFNRARSNFGYHRQQGHYLDGHRTLGRPVRRWRFLAIEKSPPYLLKLYELSPELHQLGRRQIMESRETLARCIEFETWPGLHPDTETLEMLPWEKP